MACLMKMVICADKYPGMRGLICRKTRKSCTESALVTLEQKVLPPSLPWVTNVQREQRHSYKLPNGSELVVGGLDEITKILSSEWDMIYVQEAREASEDDWEHLLTRASGRAGNMPYSQVIGDTNPDQPRHWIKQRANRGSLTLLESRHEDNPSMTPERLAVLDALTGVRHKRLRLGLWVAAEGIIYEGFDPSVHVVHRVDIPADWPRYLAIDFGYTNPLVCQWWAVDPDGRLVRYRELYRSQLLVEDAAHEIRGLSAGERIRGIVCDHDAEDRATLARHLSCMCSGQTNGTAITCSTTAAKKDVSPGIQAVAQRLRTAGDGRPRLSLVQNALVGRDGALDDRKLPACTEEEFEGYVWDDATKKVNPDGSFKAEAPLKLNDHGMDAMRYMVAYFDLKDPRDGIIGKSLGLDFGGVPHKPNADPKEPTRYKSNGVDLLMPKWEVHV